MSATQKNQSELLLDLCKTIWANTLTVVINDIVSIGAENARGLVLLENDSVAVNKYFKRILLVDIQILSDAHGKNDSTQLVDLSNDTR